MPYLSTQPEPNQNWQITLARKVIAIIGVNRGIGLGIAEVCLVNSAKVVYSLGLMGPSKDFTVLQNKYPNFKYIQTNMTEEVEKLFNLNVRPSHPFSLGPKTLLKY